MRSITIQNLDECERFIKVKAIGDEILVYFQDFFTVKFTDFSSYYYFIAKLNLPILKMKICIQCGNEIKKDYTGNYCYNCYLVQEDIKKENREFKKKMEGEKLG